MDQSPELIKLISGIFNTAVHLRTLSYSDTPERDIIIQDFNDIALITDNDSIFNTKKQGKETVKYYVDGSNVEMKDGTLHRVLQTPKDIQAKIDTLKAENKATLKQLGIRLII
tara:strand:+ start:624131 stop:624469 length:339 start_codon:yes stop_codon:yes gene_type:complete